jgi:quinol monooxygenase YgiN
MIDLQAYMEVKPDRRDEFLEKVQDIIIGSRAEEGNVSYVLYEEAGNTNRFVMLEEWKDQAAIDAHNQAPHFLKFMEDAKSILAGPISVKRFDH